MKPSVQLWITVGVLAAITAIALSIHLWFAVWFPYDFARRQQAERERWQDILLRKPWENNAVPSPPRPLGR